jgi:hypothetical protein
MKRRKTVATDKSAWSMPVGASGGAWTKGVHNFTGTFATSSLALLPPSSSHHVKTLSRTSYCCDDQRQSMIGLVARRPRGHSAGPILAMPCHSPVYGLRFERETLEFREMGTRHKAAYTPMTLTVTT